MTVEFNCETCGRHVRKRRSPANIKTPPRFCSQACHGVARRGTGDGLQHNTTVVCAACGSTARVYRAPSAEPPTFCSAACRDTAQRGAGNPAFNGGRHQLANGYIVILAPSDPDADVRGYVLEHRIVARGLIGRQLTKREVVHHVDGDKTNNAPQNLRIFSSQAEHARHHAEMKS